MRKSTIYIFIGVICLSIGIGWYFSPIQFNYLVSDLIQIEEVEEIDVNVMTPHLQKNFEVKDKADIDKVIDIFENVKIRRVIAPPITFRPPLGKTYYFSLTGKNKTVPVEFVDKDYLIIMRHTYKIVNDLDIKQIEDIINSI